MHGWVKLHRQVMNHPFYEEKRVFSKFEAWTNLLMLANYKDNKILFNSNWMTICRGQHLTSIKKLSERWGWSNRKVKKFLDLLVADGMLHYKCTPQYTLLTIVNYEFYQGREDEDAQPKHIKSTSEAYQKHTNKKEEERLRRGEEYPAPTLIRGGMYDEPKESNRPSSDFEFFK